MCSSCARRSKDNGAAIHRRPINILICRITIARWRASDDGPSLARRGVAKVDCDELAADGEIVVIEHQRARHAVLVDLELDGVDRRLVAAARRFVEIAHRDRPSLEAGKRLFARGGIVRDALGRNLGTDDGERVVDFLALLRAVVDGKLQNVFAFARSRDDPPHVLGRKDHAHLEVERLGHRLVEGNRDLVALAFGCPIDGIEQRLIEIVLRFEDELLGRVVFPGGRTQVAERDLALAVVEFRHLTELQGITLAGIAGEIVEDAPARGDRRGIAPRLRELEFVDRAVGRKLARRRQCGCVPHAQTDQRERRRRDDRAERGLAEDRHHNLPPRRPIAAQHRGAAGLLKPCCRNTLAYGLRDKAQSAKTTHPDLKRSRRISWPERLKKSSRNSELRSPRPQAPSPTTSLSSASARCCSFPVRSASTRAASSSPRASSVMAYPSRTAKKRHAPARSTYWRRSRRRSAISTRSSRWSAWAASSIPIRAFSTVPR